MNERYDYRMLEDPEDALGDLNDPAELLMIVSRTRPRGLLLPTPSWTR